MIKFLLLIRAKAEGLISDLRDAVAKEDDERIKTIMPELQQTLYSIGSSVYQQAGAAGAGADPGAGAGDGATGAGTSGGGDDVIDAEFSETEK